MTIEYPFMCKNVYLHKMHATKTIYDMETHTKIYVFAHHELKKNIRSISSKWKIILYIVSNVDSIVFAFPFFM